MSTSSGDLTWQCPFCKKTYYSSLTDKCDCSIFQLFQNIEHYPSINDGDDEDNIYFPLEKRSKTLVVNLIAGPGSGKSTTAAGIFFDLKSKGIECEIAFEFAKELVWEKSEFTFTDQIYLFAEQYHKIFRLLNQVDVVIAECPILLTPVYDSEKRSTLEKLVIEEHNKMWTSNFFLKRTKPFNPKGRLSTHSEEEAKKIDNAMWDLLKKHNIPFDIVNGNKDGKDFIVKQVLELIKYEE